jgi:rubrerythrin
MVFEMTEDRYSLGVLLEMAVAIERSAGDFYKTLARKFPEHKSLFRQLTKDETLHAETFTRLLSQRKVREVYVIGEEERQLAQYNIKVLEDTKLVDNLRMGAERAREVCDLKEAVDVSVKLEKDTLLFYHNLAMGLKTSIRQEVYKIIKVEHTHLYKVQNLSP